MNVYIKPIYVIAILLIIVAVGAISQQKTEKKVLTTDEEVPQATATLKPIPSSISTTLPQPTSTLNTSSEFRYPNSTVVSQNENSITLESSDDPNIITPWYKEKIRAMGINATAFSQTSVNGNISNKLAGAGDGKKIDVSITKSANESKTTIQLNF